MTPVPYFRHGQWYCTSTDARGTVTGIGDSPDAAIKEWERYMKARDAE